VANMPPLAWEARLSSANPPSAPAISKAVALIRSFLNDSGEPAFLLAESAFGPPELGDDEMMNDNGEGAAGAERPQLIQYAIPFNASHDWRPDRQLATYMLAQGSSAAPTYAAVSSLLAEIPPTIYMETCARRPFYILSKISTQPPKALAPARPPKQSAAAPTKGAPSPSMKRCRNGPSCPNKATCKFDHSTPPAASGSTRPRQKPQAAGSRGNGSAPPRAAAPAPKGWGPNC
jgi:hypothetical protein